MTTPETGYSAETLRSFYDRRHPAYMENAVHWEFLFKTYRGGRAWFVDNIFKYHKEGPEEFRARINRAYRFNHTREVVELVQKYLFKGKITRKKDEAPEEIRNFWDNSMRGGAGIETLVSEASANASIGGRTAVVVDNNFPDVRDEDGEKRELTIQEAKGYRVYSYTVPVTDILDYAWDEDGDGELLWIKLREWVRDDADPFESTGFVEPRIRLWTRNEWFLYKEVESRVEKSNSPPSSGAATPKEAMVQMEDFGEHKLGFVPVRLLDNTLSSDPYYASSLIEDIAYLDRSVANYLSNLDAIIQDQTFSQLAIPAQAIQRGDDTYNKVLEMGTKRVFVYDGGGGAAKPDYLSPDPKQANVILQVINKIISEIYHTVGLAGERTKEDNAVGIDNSSGVAKAYDFERVNSLLLSKARACQHLENWIAKTVMAWHNKEIDEDLVVYPETFDVMRLQDDLVTAKALYEMNAPDAVRREQMKIMVDKIFPHLKADLRERIHNEIQEWNSEVDEQPSSRGSSSDGQSRQGQVTKDTPDKDGAE